MPGVDLPISCLSDKDREDLELICELDFDYVALSFVRTAYDIQELRGADGAQAAPDSHYRQRWRRARPLTIC